MIGIMNKFCIWILLAMFFLSSCSDKDQNEQYIRRWYGKTISFPDTLTFRLFAKEKVDYRFSQSDYKLLVIVARGDCISCKLRIDDWTRFICDMDSSNVDISYLFMLDPFYRRGLYTELRSYDFSTPVCIDNVDGFRSKNKIQADESHVFLLDKENKIVAVGDPIAHKKIRNLYHLILKKKDL